MPGRPSGPDLELSFLYRLAECIVYYGVAIWLGAFVHYLPRLPQRRILREILQSSFAPSQRLTTWSGDDLRERPVSMKFHNEWEHPECPAMKWYQLQKRTSTRFKTIEHRRGLKGPFFHEFLIIHLLDGSKCRVERTGEGSQTDAIRWVGSLSHDIIQWFTSGKYEEDTPSQESELIIEVTFLREFDLIDVLAICYTLQQHRRASRYTLQRFNCYFLCTTILAILVRRTVSWEDEITLRVWATMLDGALEVMKREDPIPRKAHGDDVEYSTFTVKYLAMGIFPLLFPQSASPSDFVLNAMRSHFDKEARWGLRWEISRCLWHECLGLTVTNGLRWEAVTVTETILKGEEEGGTGGGVENKNERLKTLKALLGGLDERRFPRTELTIPDLEGRISSGFLKAFYRICRHHSKLSTSLYNMVQMEGQYGTFKKLYSTAFGLLVTALTYPVVLCLPTIVLRRFGQLSEEMVIIDMCKAFHTNPRSIVFAFPPWILIPWFRFVALGGFPDGAYVGRRSGGYEWKMQLVRGWTSQMFPILADLTHVGPRNVPGALAFLNSYLPAHIWALCLQSCILTIMKAAVPEVMKPSSEKTCIHIRKPRSREDPEKAEHEWSILEFQEFQLGRIEDHARRVNRFRLAAAPLVRSGIVDVISDVWASLPRGRGAWAR